MLTLTRKLNQGLKIGADVRVEVAKITSSWVRLAITAPRNVRILRDEIEPWTDAEGPAAVHEATPKGKDALQGRKYKALEIAARQVATKCFGYAVYQKQRTVRVDMDLIQALRICLQDLNDSEEGLD